MAANYSTNSTEPGFHFLPPSPEDMDAFLLTIDFPNPRTWRDDISVSELVLKILFCVVIITVSLIGNSLAITVLLKKKSLRRNVTNMLIVNLAVADILVTISTTWVHLVDNLAVKWVLGPFMCKYNALTQGK